LPVEAAPEDVTLVYAAVGGSAVEVDGLAGVVLAGA